ncbi:MAG: hypothetical protein ABUL48_02370 [Pseudorhodoplanes sp.]
MRSNANHAVAAVTAAAIALTPAGVAPAFAASKNAKPAEATNTDVSSSRYHRGYGYRRNAAGAAFATAIIGGIAAYAAAREYRKSRERSYYGYGAPYGGYYGGGGYGYGPGYYRY